MTAWVHLVVQHLKVAVITLQMNQCSNRTVTASQSSLSVVFGCSVVCVWGRVSDGVSSFSTMRTSTDRLQLKNDHMFGTAISHMLVKLTLQY
ncbi:hypothetical protein E2C01_011798 [Portunus trituberculatus]|uniref:Uncharacterized protein n=1 Tax=Portunus trituberculatus TaxID=210409 RepID=A0A5B7DC74_PORTR|nr:hypothetical protein [Portunus trituberculatus]